MTGWMASQDEFLRSYYRKLSPRTLSVMLGKSYACVLKRAAKFGMTRPHAFYTTRELGILRAEYGKTLTKDLAAKLKRSEHSVHIQACRMGLTRKQRPDRILRKCLCCQKDFLSGGIHNRMCNPCKAGAW